ncbi:MAG: phosphatase PAP2 family protein [Candidatus Competibacterales bacterium]
MSPGLVADLRWAAARCSQPDTTGLRWLLGLVLGGAGLAILVLATQGYRGGFAPLHALGGYGFPGLWAQLTFLGDTLLALTLLLFAARRRPDLLWIGLLAAVVVAAVVHGLKGAVGVLRPPAVLAGDALNVIGPPYSYRSFPSGHAATAFTLAALAVYGASSPLTRLAALAVAVPVAASRVVVGVHWPVDVMVGAAIGSGGVLVAVGLARHWQWGFTPWGHGLAVALLAGCAVGLVGHDGGYPQAGPLAAGVGVAALAFALGDYCRGGGVLAR